MSAITIYSRPGCHLCDETKELVKRVAPDAPITEVNISSDTDLETRYGLEIPVLMVDERKVAKYRITEDRLRRALSMTDG